jgi:3-phenylpropionate/trans-cinnamate dioxygenase ferredoxin reductase subunit
MADSGIVIVGGGLSSARFVKAYREGGGDALLRLISADTELPYHRPPLSKAYLRGEREAEDTLVEKRDFYDSHGVEVSLATLVRSADLEAKELELESGERVSFDRLVIAAGARPRPLGAPGEELENVFKLRRLADSTAIKEAAQGAERAVIVGAGFIGMEVAASLTQLGVHVTLLHRGRGLFEVLRAPPLSEYLSRMYEEQGVEVLLGEQAAEFRGNGAVRSVRTESGKDLEADLVVLGLGVAPWTDWLESTRLQLANGIVVNERYETNVDDVYAVGDVANFWDPVFGVRRRIEHWSNANHQGADLGKILATGEGGYDIVASFFSEVFGFSLRLHGLPEAGDEVIVRGDFADREAIVFYLGNGKLFAALTVGQPDEVNDGLKELLRTQPPVANRAGLSDPNVAIADLV